MDEMTIDGRTLRLAEGDITALDVDAIVNPANTRLQLGGGVAGAIRRKGGPSIQREANAIGGCPVGGAVITTGGDLPARHVIHAVGPHGGDRDADEKLASATRSALAVAGENGLASVALPAISTGIFGYPMDDCARIMIRTIRDHLAKSGAGPERVILCLYGQEAYGIFAAELERQAGG
jgi:O-acetyl-ADP-ribose deacetylase (regulator of RNase III)